MSNIVEHGCKISIDHLDKFPKGKRVGKGSTGDVMIASHKGKEYAFKTLEYQDAFLTPETLREISVMRRICGSSGELAHIMQIKGVVDCNPEKKIAILLDLEDGDLAWMIKSTNPVTMKHVSQVAQGVAYLHSRDIIHRDLKPQNILYNKKLDKLLIADFGSAKALSCASREVKSVDITTSWYRAPEIFLRSRNYSYEIDIWALGCIIFEMITGDVLFRYDESNVVYTILKMFGIPTNTEWPGFKNLPYYEPVMKKLLNEYKDLTVEFPDGKLLSSQKILILDCLKLNPKNRITALDALDYINTVYGPVSNIPKRYTCLDNLYMRAQAGMSSNEIASYRYLTKESFITSINHLCGMYCIVKNIVDRGAFSLAIVLLKYIPKDCKPNELLSYSYACLTIANQIRNVSVLGLDGIANIHKLERCTKIILDEANYDLIWPTTIDFINEYYSAYTGIRKFAYAFSFIAEVYLLGNNNFILPHHRALWCIYMACSIVDEEHLYVHDSVLPREIIKETFNTFDDFNDYIRDVTGIDYVIKTFQNATRDL